MGSDYQIGRHSITMSIDAPSQYFEELIKARRSVRAFKPVAADQACLESIFSLAQNTPSNCNTQPWQVVVASGDKLEQLRQALPEAMMSGSLSLDFPFEGKYEGVYRERQHGSAQILYEALGIDRADKAARAQAMMQNYRFFGAPHAAFLFIPEHFGIREAADIGMYAQSLMLSITAHGLASCPQTALSFQADTIRDILGIDSHLKLLFGISFGYEDTDAPANKARVPKAPLQECVSFVA